MRVRRAQPRVTVKKKIVKQRLRCCSCGDRMPMYEEGSWVMTKPKWYHNQCVPADALEANTGAKKLAMPATLVEAQRQAILALENAMVKAMQEKGITDEARAVYNKYNKFKQHFLRNANENEARQGFVLAIREVSKIIF